MDELISKLRSTQDATQKNSTQGDPINKRSTDAVEPRKRVPHDSEADSALPADLGRLVEKRAASPSQAGDPYEVTTSQYESLRGTSFKRS